MTSDGQTPSASIAKAVAPGDEPLRPADQAVPQAWERLQSYAATSSHRWMPTRFLSATQRSARWKYNTWRRSPLGY